MIGPGNYLVVILKHVFIATMEKNVEFDLMPQLDFLLILPA